MKAKKDTVSLYGSSIRLPKWLHPMFSEFLHPEMQALYKTDFLIEGDLGVGIKLNIKEPSEIGKKVKGSGIKVSHHRDDNFYLYLPNKGTYSRPYLFRLKKVSAKVRCKLEGKWLKLYWDKSNRLYTLD